MKQIKMWTMGLCSTVEELITTAAWSLWMVLMKFSWYANARSHDCTTFAERRGMIYSASRSIWAVLSHLRTILKSFLRVIVEQLGVNACCVKLTHRISMWESGISTSRAITWIFSCKQFSMTFPVMSVSLTNMNKRFPFLVRGLHAHIEGGTALELQSVKLYYVFHQQSRIYFTYAVEACKDPNAASKTVLISKTS